LARKPFFNDSDHSRCIVSGIISYSNSNYRNGEVRLC